MREILLRIKRGELKLFNEILDEYLPSVYGSVIKSDANIDQNELTAEIIMKLYNKINSYHFWKNPDSFIENSLIKIFKSYNINYNNSNNEEEVPEGVLRSIFIKLSSLNNRKKKLSVMVTVPLIVLILSISLMFYHQVYSEKLSFPQGTLVSDTSQKLYRLSSSEERIYNGFRWIDGVISIEAFQEDLALIKFVNEDSEYFYKIYKGKKQINEFQADVKYFYNNHGIDNTLIFKSNSAFYQFDYEGDIIGVINSKNIIKTSENNRYVYLQDKNDKYQIYDLYNFEMIKEVDDNILKLCNDGSYITQEQLRALKSKYTLDYYNNYYDSYLDEFYVHLDLEGNLIVFKNEEIIFEKRLLYFDFIKDKEIDLNNTMFHIDISDDLILVGVEGDLYCGLEAFDLETGEIVIHLEDTIFEGEMGVKPVMSKDKERYFLSIQRWNYRNRAARNLLFDLSERPVTAVKMSDEEFLRKAVIVADNSSCFVYTLSTGGVFNIHELK
ncbi:MAG: hypothetical protein ACLFMO_07915 [Eubacteriales bacterium]